MIRSLLRSSSWPAIWPLVILAAFGLQDGQIGDVARVLLPIYVTGVVVLLAVKLGDQLWQDRYWWYDLLRGRVSDLQMARVRALFDSYAGKFESELREDLEYRGPELALELFRRHIPSPAGLEIADLGCGTGLAGAAFRPLATRLVGCDLSQAMLERAQTTGCYDRIERTDMLKFLAERPNEFDLLLALDSVIYLPDPWPFYQAAFRSLRPGGYLLLTTELAETDAIESRRGRRRESRAVTLSLAGAAGFVAVGDQAVVLRLEAGAPAYAGVYLWRKPENGEA